MKYSKQPSSIVSVWSCLREFSFIDNLNWSIWLNDFLFWGNFLPKLNLLFSFTSLDLGPSYLKIYYMRRFVRFSTILYNLKNLKNIHGWVLLLVKFQVSTAKGSYDFMVSHMSCLVDNVVVGVELYIYFATWPHKTRHRKVMWLHEYELLFTCDHSVKFGGHRHCGSGDILFFVFNLSRDLARPCN